MPASPSYVGPEFERRRRSRHTDRPSDRHMVRVHWRGYATGSLLGIGAWAALYVLGGALACSFNLFAASTPALLAQLSLGIYGAVSASAALGWGSYVAARTGQATNTEEALYYGLGMWSMSTITLVAVAAYTAAGGAIPSGVAPLMEVGLHAVGMTAASGMGEGPTVMLWAMTMTLAVSLVLAIRGAQAGVRTPATMPAP